MKSTINLTTSSDGGQNKKYLFTSSKSTEIKLTTISYGGENKKYLFTSSKPFSSSKTKLAKSSHPTISH
jgi:hypothetical protein